jgi:hypothetical protein
MENRIVKHITPYVCARDGAACLSSPEVERATEFEIARSLQGASSDSPIRLFSKSNPVRVLNPDRVVCGKKAEAPKTKFGTYS